MVQNKTVSDKFINEKTLRLKYVRALEKFAKRTISSLKHNEFDFQLFQNTTNKNYKIFDKITTIRLDSQYLKKLERYVGLILTISSCDDGKFEEKQQYLLKEANLLHKEKNKSTYKKNKYKKSNFNDGY